MSEHGASVSWQRNGARFVDNRYSRAHRWQFDGGATVAAAASPLVVAPSLTDAAAVDPEEAFIAALSSCHMLWFLSLAAKDGWCVDSYEDDATGHMREFEPGRARFESVVLRPKVVFSGERQPDAAQLTALHEAAHHRCFLANSVATPIRIES
ncbi:OsmC family protein [Tahibacter amnicola]|uniref:OsmC family protein n=1 Tax=Tahibacter amnicola TaxID=2976241 RepID=A0ABY6BKF5_9GAMM|nr:OsmC family protein [Tahibacter amnicola]UXI69071.1 OsmC family protein [Tahibacter amnicola]